MGSKRKKWQSEVLATQQPQIETRMGNFEALWKNGVAEMIHDIKFSVRNETISCHKFVLAAVSPVFRKMFYGNFKCENEIISLPDVDPQALKNIIQFAYMGTMDTIQLEDAVVTLYAAHKYDIPEIVSHCSALLQSKICADNAVLIYQAGKVLKKKDLKENAYTYLLKNFEEVAANEEFLNLTKENLSEILQSKELNVPSELTVFKASLRWAHAACEKANLEKNGKNVSKVWGDLLKLISFPSMDQKDFADHVEPSGVLSDKEVIQIFKYFSMTESEKANSAMTSYIIRPRIKNIRYIFPELTEPTDAYTQNVFPANSLSCVTFQTKGNRTIYLKSVGFSRSWDMFGCYPDSAAIGMAIHASHEQQSIMQSLKSPTFIKSPKHLVTHTIFSPLKDEVYFVNLNYPLECLPNLRYTVSCIVNKGYLNSWSRAGNSDFTKDDFEATFSPSTSLIYGLDFSGHR